MKHTSEWPTWPKTIRMEYEGKFILGTIIKVILFRSQKQLQPLIQ